MSQSTAPISFDSPSSTEFLQDVASIARDLFGLTVQATPLHGEYDLNFKLVDAAGAAWLLKISRPGEDRALLDLQAALMQQLNEARLPVQRVMPTLAGALVGEVIDAAGETRLVRLLSYLPGRLLAHAKPHSPALLRHFGQVLGEIDAASAGFSHPAAQRELKWDLARASWIREYLRDIKDARRRGIVEWHIANYEFEITPVLSKLRRSVIHNDANDYNVLVDGAGYDARVSGLIDFGDALQAPTICNLAIALAYAVLDKRDPLAALSHVVAGYHSAHPLTEMEVSVLYPLMLMRLAVSVTNSAHRAIEEPDDPYITISERPAWDALLALEKVHPNLAHYQLRAACGWEPVPHAARVRDYLRLHAPSAASTVRPDPRNAPVHVFDLSIGSLELGLLDDLNTTDAFTDKLFGLMREKNVEIGIGRYDEPRLIYTSEDFRTEGEDRPEYRTLHIALDLFQPAGAPVFAALAGTIHSFADNAAKCDYGPCIIMEHRVHDAHGPLTFYTLYGHLSRESLTGHYEGQTIAAGEKIAWMGAAEVNGDWPPHLHFQIILDLLDMRGTFPGVARPSQRAVWLSLCPDPNVLVGVPEAAFPEPDLTGPEILAERKQRIGKNLSLSYREPLTMVRGQGAYLFDDAGRKYLDGYNNVPHVGHTHPHVVRAVQRQFEVLTTNTRYLHQNLVRYAARLAAYFPEPLKVCFFVSSGSEATELAIRLARAHTKQKDLIVSDGAYHGHTNTLIDISPYKAEGPGGTGLPEWVHKAPVPDDYRGPYKRSDAQAGPKYAQALDGIVREIQAAGRGLSGFIIESVPSVGGQIILPEGYLREAYRIVRGAGGLCIADEVQTGFGRIGSHMWAFEAQRVVPDIVALGKPIGNGFPLGAVVTTPEIAASFNNGMEFFATFGGTPVACAAGMAVLDVLERDGLMDQARLVGEKLLAGMRALMLRFPIIGDVRGAGLMLGAELVNDRTTLAPAARQASYIANRMCDKGVLIGTDGIYHNVLKVRGPMCYTPADAAFFLAALESVLGEDGAQAVP